MTEQKEAANYPHEVLIAEKGLTFDELPADIKEAIEDFDKLYNEIEAEEEETTKKGGKFELDDDRYKRLMRFSEQAATMIYGYIDEKEEAGTEAAEKAAAEKAAAEKEAAEKEAAEKEAAAKKSGGAQICGFKWQV